MKAEELVEKYIVDTLEDAEWLLTQPPEALYLVKEGVAFVGCSHLHDWPKGVANACLGKPHGRMLCLAMGDTFAYACADSEEVTPEQLPEVVDIYHRFGPVGLICWAAKERDEDPVVEYTEDPVYQATWTALYGEQRVATNWCNTIDPRWSDQKLNLPPWTPKTSDPTSLDE